MKCLKKGNLLKEFSIVRLKSGKGLTDFSTECLNTGNWLKYFSIVQLKSGKALTGSFYNQETTLTRFSTECLKTGHRLTLLL